MYSGPVLQPGQRRPTPPPPSQAEIWIGAAAGLVWPIMIVLGVFTSLSLAAAIIIAIVASIGLNRVKKELRLRRLMALQPPDEPSSLR